MEEFVAQNIYPIKSIIKCDFMKKKATLVLLILTFAIYTLNINVQITAEENDYDPTSLELTPHDPISITSDSNFTDYGFPGSGTVEEPYIIEGYNITTTDDNGIFISMTTKYFVIRNCYVEAKYSGICIFNVTDGTATVINNTCSNNYWEGIMLYYSGSSTVTNNTCNNNGDGIYLSYSGSSTVTNNTCNSNNGEGIKLCHSGSSTVTNNTCNNSDWDGIKLYNSDSSTVTNNTFTNCGLYIDEHTIDAYLSYTIENNWVNGKKLGFYTNLDSTTISEPIYGQLILVKCNSVTVCDQILNYASVGLSLYSCTSSVIINNTCNNNYYQGIKFYYSESAKVENNTCNNNWVGIKLHYSGSSTVINNTCTNNNKWGIFLASSTFCVVTYNLLQENEGYGVYSSSGSDNSIIHHNTFVDNNLGGTSQARDDGGTNTTWYDTETQEGNYWSDWSGIGNYSIDGSACSFDLYPLDEPVEYSTDETQTYFTFTLLILVVPLMLTRIISKKVKKE